MNGYIPYITTHIVGDLIRDRDQGISKADGGLVNRLFKQVFNTTRYTQQNYNSYSLVTIQLLALTKVKLGETKDTPEFINNSNSPKPTNRGYT